MHYKQNLYESIWEDTKYSSSQTSVQEKQTQKISKLKTTKET